MQTDTKGFDLGCHVIPSTPAPASHFPSGPSPSSLQPSSKLSPSSQPRPSHIPIPIVSFPDTVLNPGLHHSQCSLYGVNPSCLIETMNTIEVRLPFA